MKKWNVAKSDMYNKWTEYCSYTMEISKHISNIWFVPRGVLFLKSSVGSVELILVSSC